MGLFRNLTPYISDDSGETDIFTVLLLAAAAVSSLIPAFLHRVFFDRVIPDRSLEMIFPTVMLIILVEITGICARYFAERQLAAGCRRNRHCVRNRLTNRLWSLKVNWFNLYGTGAVTRHFDDAGILGNTRTVFLRDIVGPLIIIVLLLPSMFLLQPLLTISRILISIPAFLIGFRYLNRDLEYERRLWAVRKRLTGHLADGVRGIQVLKTGRGGRGYARHIRRIFSHLGLLEERRQVLGAGWEASAAAAGRIGGSLTLLLAVFLVVDGRLSFGSYIAFSILASRFMSALGEFLGGIRTLARTGNACFRHGRLFAEEKEDDSNSVSLVLPTPESGGLVVSGLTFRYPGSGIVLDKLDLKIRRDERILLSGGSGEGKSTLFSLILGLHSPESGDIRFSGISLVTCPFSSRRELVGAALQKPSFFNGTVRDNLCLYGAAPSDRYLWRALESAAADDIVSRLPGGLSAMLSGENSGLSGGQKQRLAIARLMVHPPPLVLLDEPVNSLDRECTERVCRSLTRACEGRTVVFISHGEIPVMPFDRRLVLGGGRILTSGSGNTRD